MTSILANNFFIVGFKNGVVVDRVKFVDAWGFAPYIWDSLWREHITDSALDTWVGKSEEEMEKLWALTKFSTISTPDKVMLACTFNGATIRKENFCRFKNHIKKFNFTYNPGNRNCHLTGVRNAVRRLGKTNIDAIGFQSHARGHADKWEKYEADGITLSWQYDLNKDKEHFEVYDLINNKL